MALPVLNQKASAAAGKKPESKGKSETVGASSAAIAAGLHKSSTTSSKSSDIEAKRQNVKGKAETAMVADTAAGGKHKEMRATLQDQKKSFPE
jgi:hypothetical protein